MEQFNDKNAKDLATFQARIKKHLAILTDLVTEQGKLKEEDIISGNSYNYAIFIMKAYIGYLSNYNEENKKEFILLEDWINLIKTPDTFPKISEDNEVEVPKINFINYTDKNIYQRLLNYFKNKQEDFKKKLFNGPPECFRWLSWCVINQIPIYDQQYRFNHYLVKKTTLTDKNRYNILKDMERTVLSQVHLGSHSDQIKDHLYYVLKAFGNLDLKFGYAQGSNLIVVFMLIVSEGNDVDTFNMLISLLTDNYIERKEKEYSFRGLFTEDLPLLHLIIHIFECKLREKYPELKNHLDDLGFDTYSFNGPWFQTLFTIFLPLNMCKRLWDCMFSDSVFFMVKFAVAFYGLIEAELMKKTELEDFKDYFNTLNKSSMTSDGVIDNKKYDVEKLIEEAKKIKIDPTKYMKSFKKNPHYTDFQQNIGKTKEYKIEFEQHDINIDAIELSRKTIYSNLKQEDISKKMAEYDADKDNIINENQINDEKEKAIKKNEIKDEKK